MGWDAASPERVVVRADQLRACGHVRRGVHQRADAGVVERPPLPGLDARRGGSVGRVRRDRHPAVLVLVRLERPERVAGDERILRECRQEAPERADRRVVRAIPAVLVRDERTPCRFARPHLVTQRRPRLPPVWIHERDADVDAGNQRVRRARQDEVPPVDAAQVRDEGARPVAWTAAAVQQIPAEDRRVVLVCHARVAVDVVHHRVDVLLDVAAHCSISPERRHVHERARGNVDPAPAQVDAAASAGARVVADDRRDQLQSAPARRRECEVDRLERSLIELPQRRLDAQGAADRVRQRLCPHDPRPHLLHRRERIVDLVVARIARSARIERPVALQPEPLDVRAAEAKRPPGQLEVRARTRDE